MKKTKICCFDISSDIIDYLSENFDVYDGSLGKKIEIKYNYNNNQYLLANHDIPDNLHEYDVIIDDMQKNDIIKYKKEDHKRKYLTGKDAYYFQVSNPQNIFDPIPLGCKYLNSKDTTEIRKNIIKILFQENLYEIDYQIVNVCYQYEKESCRYSNYEHVKKFCSTPLSGTEVFVCDNDLSHLIFEHYKDEVCYYQTFYHPKKYAVDGEDLLDENFIPLLQNDNGDIVSYAYISSDTIEFMLPQTKNKQGLLKILFNEVLFKYFSNYFPSVKANSWIEREDYFLPGYKDLLLLKEQNKKEFERKNKELDIKIKKNNIQFNFLHKILTETGDRLVYALIEYFNWLGFQQVIDKDTTVNNGLYEEDIQIDLGEEGILIIETKGINGTSTDAECSQIHKIKFRRCKERNGFDVKALYIVNNERNVEPLKRTIPPFNENQIKDAINDERGLLYTWQLFNLYFNIENGFITKEEARKRILGFGLINFEPQLLKLGKPYKYYRNQTIACIELNNTEIAKNDYLAYPINGKWRKVEILEIQQDHKQQDKVANGNVGIKVKERLPECVLYYMKK